VRVLQLDDSASTGNCGINNSTLREEQVKAIPSLSMSIHVLLASGRGGGTRCLQVGEQEESRILSRESRVHTIRCVDTCEDLEGYAAQFELLTMLLRDHQPWSVRLFRAVDFKTATTEVVWILLLDGGHLGMMHLS
jgi:hypothetical protein